jgi:hypothetical protein
MVNYVFIHHQIKGTLVVSQHGDLPNFLVSGNQRSRLSAKKDFIWGIIPHGDEQSQFIRKAVVNCRSRSINGDVCNASCKALLGFFVVPKHTLARPLIHWKNVLTGKLANYIRLTQVFCKYSGLAGERLIIAWVWVTHSHPLCFFRECFSICSAKLLLELHLPLYKASDAEASSSAESHSNAELPTG